MQATQAQIMFSQLLEVFKDLDTKLRENQIAWGVKRFEAMGQVRQEYFTASKGLPQSEKMKMFKEFHELEVSAAGGKTWFNVFHGRNMEMVLEYMEKNYRAIQEKRNVSMVKKLEKVGVTEIISSEFQHTSDGFNGYFKVMTDAGMKMVVINTIYAGGYNIQCFHQRVLIKVK